MITVVLAGCFGGSDAPVDDVRSADDCKDNQIWNETALMCDAVMASEEPEIPTYKPPFYPNDGASIKEFVDLPSEGGHMIPVTVYKPAIASAETQFPILLQSHGFTGSRMTGDDSAKPYIEAGFGVVSFDERGHGDARDDSEVTFMHPTAEVLDVITIIDYIATLDWVLMEPDDPTDPVLGTFGYSYGGAFQLMGSIFDDRIDALVPEMTWNSITTALAPNGAIKSGWVDLFYIAGNAQQSVVFSNDFHAGWAWAAGTNELPAGQAPGVPDLVTLFDEASPASYPGQLDVPTLLIQGMPDSLFPLNQAVWNYEMLRSTNTSVSLYTHLGGHVLNTASLAAGTSPVELGLQGRPGGFPCGEVRDLTIAWHQKHLLQLDVDLGPKVCIALEDETAVVGDEFPLEGTEFAEVDVGGPFPIAQAAAGTGVPLYTVSFDDETIVAGIPRLSGSLTSPGPDSIVYFSFYTMNVQGVMEHIVDDQVRPLRIKGPNTGPVEFDIELGGIATRLGAGDEMILMATSLEPMYFGNSQRLPAGVVLDELTLQLPVIKDPVQKA